MHPLAGQLAGCRSAREGGEWCFRRRRGFHEFGGAVAHLPAFAMEGDGEAVGFVTNELNQMQHG